MYDAMQFVGAEHMIRLQSTPLQLMEARMF
jgi:hypothetical protein